MAVKWSRLAWTLDLKPTQMLVAQAVADYAHKVSGKAWPSQQTVATKTGLSKRTVWERIHELEQLGVLIKVAEPKWHMPAVYEFNPDPPVARKPGPESQELPPSESQTAPSDSQTAPSGSQFTGSRVEGDANKPSGTVTEPSLTDRDEARRIVKDLAAAGKAINDPAAYEAKVAENLAKERWHREQTEQAVALIAECERCDDRGLYFEEAQGGGADTGYKCSHGIAK